MIPMQPTCEGPGWQIYQAHVLDALAALPERSVQVCVTSPPYFSLRAYQTEPQTWPDGWVGELGSEPTVGQYVANLVEVFRAVGRVLRDDGTLWVNLGSSYAGSGRGLTGHNGIQNAEQWQGFTGNGGMHRRQLEQSAIGNAWVPPPDGYKHKDLIMTPFLVAEALRQDGWYLRQAITLCKVAPMPESVTDRPTSATEMLFLLSKAPTYFYDQTAVAERALQPEGIARLTGSQSKTTAGGFTTNGTGDSTLGTNQGAPTRNLRNWIEWRPSPLKEAHYAAFAPFIPKLAVSAGSSAHGACSACGSPYKRVVSKGEATRQGPVGSGWREASARGSPSAVMRIGERPYSTEGWAPTCQCDCPDVVPQTILDIFAGSGTTLLVANRLGRHAIGIELQPTYVEIARKRLEGDAPLVAAIEQAPTPQQSSFLEDVS